MAFVEIFKLIKQFHGVILNSKTVLPQTFVEIDLNYYLNLVRDDCTMESLDYAPIKTFSPDKNIVFLLSSDSLGKGKTGLGQTLLLELLNSLIRNNTKPGTIILMNSGVCLAHKDPFAGRLLVLEEQGVKIMVCISSADKYGITDCIKAGFLSGMDEITSIFLSGAKIITLS